MESQSTTLNKPVFLNIAFPTQFGIVVPFIQILPDGMHVLTEIHYSRSGKYMDVVFRCPEGSRLVTPEELQNEK